MSRHHKPRTDRRNDRFDHRANSRKRRETRNDEYERYANRKSWSFAAYREEGR